MTKRHDIRESAFLLIFEKLFRDDSLEEIFELADSVDEIIINDDVKDVVIGVFSKSEELDTVISKFSDKRAIDRIAKINLAILRLALYEIMYAERVPMNAAISEAVLLAKQYALEPDVAFVNGVLGSYARSTEAEKND